MSDPRDLTPQPTAGDISDEPKKRRSWRTWICWSLALLALYVLSIGPMSGFFGITSDPWPRLAYDWFYTPLWWVCDRVPPVGRAVEWYMDLWWRLGWKADAPFHFPSW